MSTLCVRAPRQRGSTQNWTDSLPKQDALQPFQSLLGCTASGQGAGSCDGAAVLRPASMKQRREQVLLAGGGVNDALDLAAELQS